MRTYVVVSQTMHGESGCRDVDSLGKLECYVASAPGTAKGHKRMETKEVTVTEVELKTLLLKKKREERRTAPRASRDEQALSDKLEKTESAEARETLDQDQGECRDGNASKKRALEKLESGLCGWNADLSEETCESLEKIQKLGKVHWIRSQRMF